MNRPFDGRVALITGASSGIGRALAGALAAGGCRVGLVARREMALVGAAAAIRSAGGVAEVATADVADRASIRRAAADLAGRLGPIDLAVANAGLGIPTTLDPMNLDDIEATIRVNVLGVIETIGAVLPAMLARGSGHLAAISSLAAYRGMPGESAYCASKAAVNSYMDGLRVQLRGRGVHASTICPGFVRTPMTAVNNFEMPFALDADDAARRIVRALGRRAKVYDFPWQTAWLMKLARWAPDWAMARVFRDYMEDLPMPAPAATTAGGP